MSNKRIYYWLIYITIVIITTYIFKKLESNSDLFLESINKYSAYIIYGIILIMGYKNFVFDPRKKDE